VEETLRQMLVRYRQMGGHVHCKVYTAPDKDRTFALCGELVFDEREWTEVREGMVSGPTLEVRFEPEERGV
jgi:hypothetical protein